MNVLRSAPKAPNGGTAPSILVVEDEQALGLLLSYNLEAEGFTVERVERGDEAEVRLSEMPPDLVILDWMLPGVSGLEICRRLRARESTRTLPVIMLTARGEEAERVRGLSVGADDYVVKPFSVPELMARVRSLLRRSRPERVASRLSAGDLDLDRETRRVRRGTRDIHLGPTEFRLLDYLMERPGRVFSRSQLLDGVWGQSVEIDERTVDVHVGRHVAREGRVERVVVGLDRGIRHGDDDVRDRDRLGAAGVEQQLGDLETGSPAGRTRAARRGGRARPRRWRGPPQPPRLPGGRGPARCPDSIRWRRRSGCAPRPCAAPSPS